ncbi:bargin-like [Mugil cephalus]|uniref:bargin-like n=1 Tax=Mugil cephalus TaxID=48193 RepID=UPI001FB67F74|nr:bargin-like [Mugil cephalus]
MGRVFLQDGWKENGDVSLILNNVTTDDSGTYECHVETKTNRKTTSIILNIVPPGKKEDEGDKDGGDKSGSWGLKVDLSVGVLALFALVVLGLVMIYRCRRRQAPAPAPVPVPAPAPAPAPAPVPAPATVAARGVRLSEHFNHNSPRNMWKDIRTITDYKRIDQQANHDPTFNNLTP